MVFQGFSFFAMAIVSMGVLAYHFYKNREAYFNDNPQSYNVYNYTPELEPAPIEDETGYLFALLLVFPIEMCIF